MDAGNVGYGAGGGLLSAILTYVGFKQRQDRTDKDVADLRESTEKELTELKRAVVFKDTCGVCHNATLRAVDGLDKKLDKILDKME